MLKLYIITVFTAYLTFVSCDNLSTGTLEEQYYGDVNASLNEIRDELNYKLKSLHDAVDIKIAKLTKTIESKSDNPDLTKEFHQMQERLVKAEQSLNGTNEKLTKTEENLVKSQEELKAIKERLSKAEESLAKPHEDKGPQKKLDEIFSVVFNNKLSHYQLFTDLNGKNKAFIIPISAMKKQHKFDDSVKICKNFNSTLIEIESSEKQIILESFLGRLGFETNTFQWSWINGRKDSSGDWNWIKSKNHITYNNWGAQYTNAGWDNLIVHTYSGAFGKWYNWDGTNGLAYVICEYTFEF